MKIHEIYMVNAKILRLVPNATYIPLTCVWVSRWVTQILGLASGVFAFLDTNMLVSFALGDAKFWRRGHCPTQTPDARTVLEQPWTFFLQSLWQPVYHSVLWNSPRRNVVRVISVFYVVYSIVYTCINSAVTDCITPTVWMAFLYIMTKLVGVS